MEVGRRGRGFGLGEVEARVVAVGRRQLAQPIDHPEGGVLLAVFGLRRGQAKAVFQLVRVETPQGLEDVGGAPAIAGELAMVALDPQPVGERQSGRQFEGAASRGAGASVVPQSAPGRGEGRVRQGELLLNRHRLFEKIARPQRIGEMESLETAGVELGRAEFGERRACGVEVGLRHREGAELLAKRAPASTTSSINSASARATITGDWASPERTS